MSLRLMMFICVGLTVVAQGGDVTSFDADWRFARFGAMPDGSQLEEPAGLAQPGFDDSSWRTLDVPHDWGIEGPFRMDLPNKTGKLPWAGIGWYRKSFDAPESDKGRRIYVDFDGAMSGTTVFLNGEQVGEWPYGYSSFRVELTDKIKVGAANLLAVRLNNKAESSRWYPGGGIYRHVRLVKTAPVHIAHWGVFVTTPQVSEEQAEIHIETAIEGVSEGLTVRHEIIEAGKVLATGDGATCSIVLPKPKPWDLKSPNLYQINTTLTKDGEVIDWQANTFGVRSIEYAADKGFLLNGRVVRMNGVCQHHDLGPLGSAVNRRALERQVEILKEMGVNAIRTAHNPPAPELLDICDRLGVLVQVEAFDCWARAKARNDYARHFRAWHERDLVNMVRRDRNHPCVVMWSTGNELRELGNPDEAVLSQMLTDIIRREDPTRPVTLGANYSKAGFNGFEKTVDVFGYNYKPHLYAEFREKNPAIPLYGSETASTLSSRGEYFFPVSNNKKDGQGGYFQVSSYDLTAPRWAYRPEVEFEALDQHPEVFGEFVWTGFDYIGEPTPYNNDKTNLLNIADPVEREKMKKELDKLGGKTPPRSSYFGIVDLCGFKKDRFYLYQARWRPEFPMAHILPHWNWPERMGEVTPVHVYTSGDEAELFLNGRSLGRKKKGAFAYRLRWDDVVYEPGELLVVAYKYGKEWAKTSMKTTELETGLKLTVDRSSIAADGSDLAFVTVEVVDEAGLMVPRTHNSVAFSLEGPGEIIAMGNGDPTNHESFQSTTHKVFNGKALAVIRARKSVPGKVVLTARSEGLTPARIIIYSELR